MAAFVTAVAEGTPGHLVLCGSPRANGRCALLSQQVAREILAGNPRAGVAIVQISHARIAGCVGCDACREQGECVQRDDMGELLRLLDAADELHVVSPVYFAGPPSQLKAALDRLQPHYWKQTRLKPKRPAHLHVVGDGGDPHGFEPLVTICRSALSVAGFRLVSVEPHIGAAPADDSEEA